jgi:hypothetical protein
VRFRHLWLARPVTENQSVVVDHIPLHLRSNHGLYTFFDSLFPNQVASVSIVLDVKGLDTLIKLRDKTAAQLDYALATYARSRYKRRPTFVFHNWRSRLGSLWRRPSSTRPERLPLRAGDSADPAAQQTPLLSAVDATNNRLNVGVKSLTGGGRAAALRERGGRDRVLPDPARAVRAKERGPRAKRAQNRSGGGGGVLLLLCSQAQS